MMRCALIKAAAMPLDNLTFPDEVAPVYRPPSKQSKDIRAKILYNVYNNVQIGFVSQNASAGPPGIESAPVTGVRNLNSKPTKRTYFILSLCFRPSTLHPPSATPYKIGSSYLMSTRQASYAP
jgi:hypothetical protein